MSLSIASAAGAARRHVDYFPDASCQVYRSHASFDAAGTAWLLDYQYTILMMYDWSPGSVDGAFTFLLMTIDICFHAFDFNIYENEMYDDASRR